MRHKTVWRLSLELEGAAIMQIRPTGLFVIIVLALLTFYSRLIFLLSPGLRTWGIDHLQFLSIPHTIIYSCCFLILCLMLIPKLNSFFVQIFDNLSNLFGGKIYSKWAIAALVSLPIFWFLRMPTPSRRLSYNSLQESSRHPYRHSRAASVCP